MFFNYWLTQGGCLLYLTDSGWSKHYIDTESIREVEMRMPCYTKISSPMEIKAAGDNILYSTAPGILLV